MFEWGSTRQGQQEAAAVPPVVASVIDDAGWESDWEAEFAALVRALQPPAAPQDRAAEAVGRVAAARRAESMRVWDQLCAVADLVAASAPVAVESRRQGGALDLDDLVDDLVVTELALACGWSRTAAAHRLDAAVALLVEGRLPRSAALLARGLVDWPRVQVLVQETKRLEAGVAAAVEAVVVDPSTGLMGATVPRLRTLVREAVAAAAPEEHEAESRAERSRRDVISQPDPDGAPGMGRLLVRAPMEAVAAVGASLQAAVAAARAAGDPRSAGEVRCDELVARVVGRAWAGKASPSGGEAASEPVPASTEERSPSEASPARRTSPALRVLLTMSWETWTGLRDDPARLEGYGPLAASLARELVASLGDDATWQCAVVDGKHGTLLGLGRSSFGAGYVPSARAREFVSTARPRCSVPVCGVASVRCDLDHREPFPAGATCACNLQPLCRTHHRLKTAGLLTAHASTEPGAAPGTVVWTTRAGRSYSGAPPSLRPATAPARAAGAHPPCPDDDPPF